MIGDRGDNEGFPPGSANLGHGESLEGSSLRFDDWQTNEQRIHLLEIELRRIRKEASAARLDARAAEIELMIRRLSESGSDASGLPLTPADAVPSSQQSLETPQRQLPRFQSWDEVREAQQRFRDSVERSPSRFRFDGPAKPHHHLGWQTNVTEDASDESVTVADGPVADSPMDIQADANADTSTDEISFAQQLDAVLHDERPKQIGVCAIAEDLELDDDELDADRSVKKSRPMAMIISAVLHAVVLLLLAGWTLSTHKPKDQVSITASATAASSEESMETFTLDASEPELEPTEPTESETEYELSPIGEIAVSEFSADIAPPPPSPSAASMMSSSAASSSAAAAISLSAFSDAKIQFCGVEGGGNHFVYLVDSSGSMGDSFDSARKELLNSIDFLKPDQRFYVIFFGADPDFMRLANSSVDEPRSVEATPENKLALKRWAMQIGQDRGKNPYEVLEFALTLRPDVIFLLSDGEFPQRIEDLLQEKNRIENLFGDNGPMCIVHTIAYYSKEGEVRMRRIAEKNGGQYRYVPRP